jgi:hypothetical protein
LRHQSLANHLPVNKFKKELEDGVGGWTFA